METKFKVGDTVYSKSYNKCVVVESISIRSIVSYYYYNLWSDRTWKEPNFSKFDQESPMGGDYISISNELIPILYGIECE